MTALSLALLAIDTTQEQFVNRKGIGVLWGSEHRAAGAANGEQPNHRSRRQSDKSANKTPTYDKILRQTFQQIDCAGY